MSPAFGRLMQEDYINEGQPGLHSEPLSQAKQKCIFLKDIILFIVCVCVSTQRPWLLRI